MKPSTFPRLIVTAALWLVLATSASRAESTTTNVEQTAPRLQARIAERESAARALAEEIITLRQSEHPSDAALSESQKKLRQILAEVFELKLQWEELQIKELQQRLTRCERQLRQRRDLRDRIIDHRVSQLIDKSGLEWNGSDPGSPNGVNANTAQPSAGVSERDTDYDLQAVLTKYLPDAAVEVHKLIGGNVLIKGSVRDLRTVTQVMEIANLYAPSVLNQIIVDPSLPTRDMKAPLAGLQSRESPAPESAETELQAALKKYFPDVVLEFHQLIGGNVLIRGTVSDPKTMRQILELATLYSPSVISHISVNPGLAHSPAANSETRGDDLAARTSGEKRKEDLSVSPPESSSAEESKSSPQDAVSTKEKRQEVLDNMRQVLEPSAKEMTAAAKKVQELEEEFLHAQNRFGKLDELKQALAQAKKSSREFFMRIRDCEPNRTFLENEQTLAQVAAEALEKRLKAATGSAKIHGSVDLSSLKRALEASTAAQQNLQEVNEKLAAFQSIQQELNPLNVQYSDYTPKAKKLETDASTAEYRADVAQAFLQAGLNVKLELVSCKGLELWFEKALRVCETSPDYTNGDLKRGDLIVELNGFTFDNWGQAARAARTSGSARNSNDVNCEVKYLQGGLLGGVFERGFSSPSFSPILQSSEIGQTQWNFEVHVRDQGSNKTVARYVTGVCVSPTGLVVLPVSRQSLVDAESDALRIQGASLSPSSDRITAKIVASDPEHGLTLVQRTTQSSGSPHLAWASCAATKPALNQTLHLWNGETCKVVSVDDRYALPRVGHDGFGVTIPNSNERIAPQPLAALNGHLQGLVVESSPGVPVELISDSEPVAVAGSPCIVVPAVHVEKLLNSYLEKNPRQ